MAGALGLAALELRDPRLGRHLREAARLQVVAHVAARDGDDLAAEADLVDVLQQDDVHQRLLTWWEST